MWNQVVPQVRLIDPPGTRRQSDPVGQPPPQPGLDCHPICQRHTGPQHLVSIREVTRGRQIGPDPLRNLYPQTTDLPLAVPVPVRDPQQVTHPVPQRLGLRPTAKPTLADHLPARSRIGEFHLDMPATVPQAPTRAATQLRTRRTQPPPLRLPGRVHRLHAVSAEHRLPASALLEHRPRRHRHHPATRPTAVGSARETAGDSRPGTASPNTANTPAVGTRHVPPTRNTGHGNPP